MKRVSETARVTYFQSASYRQHLYSSLVPKNGRFVRLGDRAKNSNKPAYGGRQSTVVQQSRRCSESLAVTAR